MLSTYSIKDKKSIRDSQRKELFKKLFSGEMTTWEEFSDDPDI